MPWHISETMTETQDKKPAGKPDIYNGPAKPKLSALDAKRAQNLRDNLMKRKQQARARDAVGKDDPTI
jgi:hypothetical protein